ncbi:hypothetical protein CEXT_222811 [Caerostris extrusa]|uniref:Uncharacterized protein n=1 Tax=Caerostris extrusa TaxID=172846 RepID=A0AAV4NP72_CAEEX|nr:hypothetical protein CEXT_222811 [Caerostris extrusa]
MNHRWRRYCPEPVVIWSPDEPLPCCAVAIFYWEGASFLSPRESLISCGRLYTGISVIHRPLQSGFPAADKSGAFSSPSPLPKGASVERGMKTFEKGSSRSEKGHVSGGNEGISIK